MGEIQTTESTVKRTVPAAPADVYDVWLDARSPGSPWSGTARAIVNPVVGGLFHHSVEHAGNAPDDEMGRRHADGWAFVLASIAERFAGR